MFPTKSVKLSKKKEFNLKFKVTSSKYLGKNVRELKESEPGKAYATLKRMGTEPGDELNDGSFTNTQHLEDNLTGKQSGDKSCQDI